MSADKYQYGIYHMEWIIDREGTDNAQFKPESKKAISSAASFAVSIKSVLDTAILTDTGNLTDESALLAENLMSEIE